MSNILSMSEGPKTAMYVGKLLVWDWKDLVNALQNGKVEFSENDAVPTRVDDDYIEFCKIKLNIRSLIYRTCSIDDLIEGWNGLNTKFDLVRVVELFLWTSMERLKGIHLSEIYKIEPDVIDFLKICYWYSKIRRTPTVVHKTKELRTRLARRLLYKLETGKVSINYEGLSEDEIQRTINEKMDELNQNETGINRKKQLLNEYFDFVSVSNSELMYTSLSEEYGHRIGFEPRNEDFDFDIMIDSLPFQVKTLTPLKYFPISDLDISKLQKYEEQVAQIRYLYYSSQLNQSSVQQRVLDYVKNRCISQINTALKQKAKAVILDSTRTAEGWLLNQLFSDDQIYVKFDESLKRCIENNSNQYVNVVFASTAYDYNYRISTLALKLHVKDGKVDESRKNEIELL